MNAMPLLVPLAIASFALWWRWKSTRGWMALAALGLAFGIGLSTKLSFAWVIAGIALTQLAVYGIPRGVRLPHAAAFALLFVAGSAPLLMHNVTMPLHTVWFVGDQMDTTWAGQHNLDFAENFATRVGQLGKAMSGLGEARQQAGMQVSGFRYANEFCLFCAIAGLAGALYFAGASRGEERKRAAAAALLPLAMLPLSAFTVSVLSPAQLLPLLPFVFLLMAYSASRAWEHSLRGRVVALALLGLLVSAGVALDAKYLWLLQQSGGAGLRSDAMYMLGDYLSDKNLTRPVAMDWGFLPLFSATGGDVRPVEMFAYEPPGSSMPDAPFGEHSRELARQALSESGGSNVFLFHSTDCTVFPRFELLQAEAEAMGLTLVEAERFMEGSGRVVYTVFKAVPVEEAATLPSP
jgi:hypothetical protein